MGTRRVRQTILNADSDFGKKCLDYFDSLKLQDVEGDSSSPPTIITGYSILEEKLKTSWGVNRIKYRVIASQVIRPNEGDETKRVSFKINILDDDNGSQVCGGYIDKKHYTTEINIPYCRVDNKWGFNIQKKFLNEMLKAYNALLPHSKIG